MKREMDRNHYYIPIIFSQSAIIIPSRDQANIMSVLDTKTNDIFAVFVRLKMSHGKIRNKRLNTCVYQGRVHV